MFARVPSSVQDELEFPLEDGPQKSASRARVHALFSYLAQP